jgi:hypothetical protein
LLTCPSVQVGTDEDSFELRSLEPGKLMASPYIRLDTMANVCCAPERIGMEFLLGLLAKAQEFEYVRLRRWVKSLAGSPSLQ